MNTNNYIMYEFPDAKSVVVSGDIHGDFTQLVYKCCIQYSMTDTVIIVAGDCGFGLEKPGYYENLYKRCRERLSKANNWLLFVRGNHDNPAYFNLLPIKHRRWMTLPDYSVVKACGHTILCVGGATSIDRTYRMCSKHFHFQKPDAPFVPNVYWPTSVPFLTKPNSMPSTRSAPSIQSSPIPLPRSASYHHIKACTPGRYVMKTCWTM